MDRLETLLIRRNAWIESIKINAITRDVRDGRPFWVKRRRTFGRAILAVANMFFRVAGAPMRALAHPTTWQRWEIDSFHLLHGTTYRALALDENAVGAEELPGINLTVPLDDGTLSDRMARAAGAELRRAHCCDCAHFGSGWSHGDPHLGNFIYDASADRARLIDFEVRHLRSLPVERRQADDVLVVLQDILGRSASARWIAWVGAFLEGYGHEDRIAEAMDQLAVPSWPGSIWWSIRTSWLSADETRLRIRALHEHLRINSPRAQEDPRSSSEDSARRSTP